MPMARIERTRRSLPEGYQFGDARPLVAKACHYCGGVNGHSLHCDLMVGDHRSMSTGETCSACGFHRADTLDPDGYGHAV